MISEEGRLSDCPLITRLVCSVAEVEELLIGDKAAYFREKKEEKKIKGKRIFSDLEGGGKPVMTHFGLTKPEGLVLDR